jgi:23S rRNA (guanosine2251-2'-O)-methyltransferase
MAAMKNKREGSRPLGGWLYGLNPVVEAMRGGRALKVLYIYSGRRQGVGAIKREAEKRGIPVEDVHEAGFFDARFPKGHQGVAARVVARGPVPLDELFGISELRGEAPFYLVLDLIEDPRNLGAILRSAEAAGVHGVVMQKRRAAGLGPVVSKTSAGASEHIALSVEPNVKHAIERMKRAGVTVAGAEAGPHPAPWDVPLGGPLALVIGSEGGGLRRTVRQMCDLLVSLPLMGMVGSLNASVAAGILIYEALRQRG